MGLFFWTIGSKFRRQPRLGETGKPFKRLEKMGDVV